MQSVWTEEKTQWLCENYPKLGKRQCMAALAMTESQIRSKAAKLGLRQNRNSEFFKDWQRRAAKAKVGKKRPDQSLVMKGLWEQGKLCSPNAETRAKISVRRKEYLRQHDHPRGALGMSHSDAFKRDASARSRRYWADPESKFNSFEYRQGLSDRMSKLRGGSASSSAYSRCKYGRREDLGNTFFRSKWEANFARYLNWMKDRGEIHSWTYEAKTFWFEDIKRGVRSYTPDFEVIDALGSQPRYIEVKGWMDDRSKTKIKRMAKYYPDVKLEVFDQADYRTLKQLSFAIPGWEK